MNIKLSISFKNFMLYTMYEIWICLVIDRFVIRYLFYSALSTFSGV